MLLGIMTHTRWSDTLKGKVRACVQAFPMYGGLGVSAPSLHRESTDSLISSKADIILLESQ